jgi:heavy metal-binding protein
MVVAGRAILLMFAAGAATFALFLARVNGSLDLGSQARYACPMHREVTTSAPGKCPICGMELVKLAGGSTLPSSAETLVRGQPGLVDTVKRRVFTHEIRAAARLEREGVVQALLYDDEIQTLEPGERGTFHPTAAPATSIDVWLASGPPVRWDASTSMIEFRVGGGRGFPLGTAGWLDLGARPRPALVIPSSAVLRSSEGTYVLAASGDGRTFTKRQVHIGRTVFGLSVVVAGLYEKERVVARSAFFLDAEGRLGAGAEPAAAVKP